jgi:hypothetical protein
VVATRVIETAADDDTGPPAVVLGVVPTVVLDVVVVSELGAPAVAGAGRVDVVLPVA